MMLCSFDSAHPSQHACSAAQVQGNALKLLNEVFDFPVPSLLLSGRNPGSLWAYF